MRKIVAFTMLGFAALAAHAQDEISPCAAVTDDKSRLQCYDAETAAKKARAASRAPTSAPAASMSGAAESAARTAAPDPAPKTAASPTVPSISGSAATEFGAETLPRKRVEGEPAPAAEISAKVTSITGRGKGDYRITLDNGQVWAETQRTGGEPPQVGETVTLRRGSLGSYFLSNGVGLALRVKRVK